MFTRNLKGNRRINKKILRWSLDIEEYGDRVKLHWIKGTDNVMSDTVSRNPVDRDKAREQAMPGGPVKTIMRNMFAPRIDNEAEWDAFQALVETLGDDDVDRDAAAARWQRRRARRLATASANSFALSLLAPTAWSGAARVAAADGGPTILSDLLAPVC